MKKSFQKIIFPWLLIVLSFLISSACLNKHLFYLFDVFWRTSIIVGVYFFGGIRLSFSLRQWLILLLVFILNCLIVQTFSLHSTLYAFLSVVLGPFSEELFFRGWLISQIRGNNMDKIVKSSLFFGLYHLKNVFLLAPPALIYQVLYAGLVIGPISAWLRLRYNSLSPAVALHSFNNMIGLTITNKIFPMIVEKKV